jgi:hypothetical protein
LLPRRGDELPQRNPAEESIPQRSGSLFERAASSPSDGGEPLQHRSPFEPLPRRSDALPQRGSTIPSPDDTLPRLRDALVALGEPDNNEPLPDPSSTLPERGDSLPHGASELPQRGDAFAKRRDSEALPERGGDQLPQSGGETLPHRGFEALPQRGSDQLPQSGGEALPQRGEPRADGHDALPRRTTRTRPAGRHRSPHRLSVASDAPALVLAVPGSAQADSAEIGPRVASIAGLSCPGVDIRVGYVEGRDLSLADCLLPAGVDSADHDQFPSVIVPLLLGPSPNIDAILRRMAAQAAITAVVAGHLGPHPLVAEALHVRLAEAGLARHARATGLSISADGRGVIVLADKDEQAASAAAVAAVLLASRLSVPVVPASLGDPASIADAVTRLSESGSPRPALAPCLIGPETSLPVLDDLSAALGAPASATLGAHQAVGQLVAIRYGAALASLSLAG